LIETNIERDIRPPKVSKRVISTLSDDEIIYILKACNPINTSKARSKTIFMLLLDMGMKIG
jgi:site-specific recombinase XerD